MRKTYLSAMMLLAISTTLYAQQGRVWSLGDCIEYAMEKNLSLQQSGIAVENQQDQLMATQLSRLPGINGNLGQSFNIGRGQNREGIYEDKGNSTTSVGVNASVTLFQGMKTHFQAKADKLELQAVTMDMAQAREDLSIQITAAYLQVLYAKDEEGIARKKLEINQDLLERTRKMVEGGKSSQSELYDAESSLASARSNLVEAMNARQNAVLELTQQMNLLDWNGEDFDLMVPADDILFDNAILSLTPVDTFYNDYIERRPSIMAQLKRVEEADHSVKVAKSSWYPSLSVGASYNTGYYAAQSVASGTGQFWQQLAQNGTPTVGISLNIPIFDKLSTHYSVRRAKNNVRLQQIRLQQEKQTVYKEVQQAYINAKAAFGKYDASAKACEAAQKAFEFEQKKYEAGRSTAYQFNEMSIKLANAQSAMAQARYSFIFRSKILNFYKGEPLY